MRLLAIDTTEDACSAALLIDDAIEERFEVAPRRHTALVLPMIEGLLADADQRPAGLDAIAFARGPGSFTGVRIAAAVAQGIAFAADLPVVPVSSLQALAQGAWRGFGAQAVLTALDARMQEVYWAAYRRDGAGIMRPEIAECVCRPQQLAVPEGRSWTGVGSGWASYGDALAARCGAVHAVLDQARVHAQDVARLAVVSFDEGRAVAPEQALPVYLRDQVAWAKA